MDSVHILHDKFIFKVVVLKCELSLDSLTPEINDRMTSQYNIQPHTCNVIFLSGNTLFMYHDDPKMCLICMLLAQETFLLPFLLTVKAQNC